MTNKWLEMRLTVPDQAVDLVSQALMDLGCTGITAAEKVLDTFVVPAPERPRQRSGSEGLFRLPGRA